MEAFQKAINELPPDQQKILHLHYNLRVPVREISSQLKLSNTTTYNKLHKALFILRNEFNPSVYDGMYKILYPITGRPVK